MPVVNIDVCQNGTISCLGAEKGENLLYVLRNAGMAPEAPCGGNGKCGKCRVTVTDETGTREVLACGVTVIGDCRVEVETVSGGAICEERRKVSGSGGGKGFGLAVDIGTTTVAVSLADLEQGKILGVRSTWNPQAPYGGDVITRMQYGREHTGGAEHLSSLVRKCAAELGEDLCRKHGVPYEAVSTVFAAGNTVMEHIFAGFDPSPIAVAPFLPRTLFSAIRSLSVPELAGKEIMCAPCVAGYVGGDITAGLLAAGLHEYPGRSLFLDVGTNGEMALGGKDGFLCCAVACGPAFEGAEISCGMASVPGAVRRVSWTEKGFSFDVIGGGKPRGICGSGLLDLLAVLLKLEIVDESGRLLPPAEVPPDCASMVRADENGNGVFYLAEGVYLRAADVRKLQLAKAAVAAGIEILLAEAGIGVGDVERLCLAGGFGSCLDPESAAAIGMIPKELVSRTAAMGNTSLAGAETALLRPEQRTTLDGLRDRCRYIELSTHRAFNDAYVDNMFF